MLGSGLGAFADEIEDATAIPMHELPGWPPATAPGHVGRLILGRLAGVPVVALQGRFHLYEGFDVGLVIQPMLLFRRLGARVVLLTNAAGGVNPAYGAGTLMVIADHLNLTGRSPLLGPNADALGDRFPDLTDVWSPVTGRRSGRPGRRRASPLEEGVYAGLLGPALRDARRGSDARGRWAPTRSGCRRWSRRSRRAGSGSRSAASRW